MKATDMFLKIVYWTSVVLITFCVITQILYWVLPLELSDDASAVYTEIRFCGFVVAVLYGIYRIGSKKNFSESILSKVTGILVVSCFGFFIMIAFLFSGMCSWSTEKVFFEDAKDISIQIVERHFGCGATDSGEPRIEIVKVNQLTRHLFWITEIDTATIDKSRWKKL